MNTLRLLPVLAAAAALASPTSAQFPGDVYFIDPTPAVIEGQSVTLTVEFFAATDVLGALSADVFFDTTQFRVDEVRPVSAGGLDATVHDRGTSLGHAFAAYNDGALDAPFGTIAVVEIVGTPLVSAGQSVQLTLAPRETLLPTGADFPTQNGLSALVTVVSGVAPNSSEFQGPAAGLKTVSGPIRPWFDPRWGNVPIAHPGRPVRLWSLSPGGLGSPIWLMPLDPSAPRE